MSERLSISLGASHDDFESAGVFDGVIDRDSPLYIDPHLLATSCHPEMKAAAASLQKYWRKLILVVRNIWDEGDRFWREGFALFQFPENPRTGLGYAKRGRSGTAIGRDTARSLLKTASELVRAGIEEPEIFEIVGLLEPNVGPDLISDMTACIIREHLAEFSQRVSLTFRLPALGVNFGERVLHLPKDPLKSNDYLLLVPKDVLRDLPTVFCWQDIDLVCVHNNQLRTKMNQLIGTTWRRAIEDVKKEKLKATLIENPDALRDLLEQYRNKPSQPYDFGVDVLGETIWLEKGKEFAGAFPLLLPVADEDNVEIIVKQVCTHFCKLVEDCGLNRLFWTDDGQLRHERFAQMLFFAVADCYCKANNLDLSPECDSGRGPVDFKISSGYQCRVIVEVKWSSNTRLRHGYESQLAIYGKAESTDRKVFLILQVRDSRSSIEAVQQLRTESLRNGQIAPEIVVADARVKASASRHQ
jgi:hypothetical protein